MKLLGNWLIVNFASATHWSCQDEYFSATSINGGEFYNCQEMTRSLGNSLVGETKLLA